MPSNPTNNFWNKHLFLLLVQPKRALELHICFLIQRQLSFSVRGTHVMQHKLSMAYKTKLSDLNMLMNVNVP